MLHYDDWKKQHLLHVINRFSGLDMRKLRFFSNCCVIRNKRLENLRHIVATFATSVLGVEKTSSLAGIMTFCCGVVSHALRSDVIDRCVGMIDRR